MERLLFVMKLRDGMVEEYERRHEEVWPDLLGDLWAAGWRNYSLFRRGLEVYGYAECHPRRRDRSRGNGLVGGERSMGGVVHGSHRGVD